MTTTLHGLISELANRSPAIASMNLASSSADATLSGKLLNLANSKADLDRVSRAVEVLLAKGGLPPADAETSVRQLISERHFYGAFCELATYDWLDRHDVAFQAQVKLTGSDVLNPNGCTIDGQFTAIDGYFDIKGMGFEAYVTEQFRDALEKQLPGLDVVIDGPMDIAVKDIEAHAFSQLPALKAKLANGGIESIPALGWTVRAQHPQRVTTTTHTTDPYLQAAENRYYPFKTAGQFSRKAPFVLIFTYSHQFNQPLSVNFTGMSDIMLRSLARRAFIQLTADQSQAASYDKQVAAGTLISDAAKLLSGLLFIHSDSDKAWLFVNPRATHKLTEYDLKQLFDFNVPTSLGVDDFAHDDY
jgi:hypothetical protein